MRNVVSVADMKLSSDPQDIMVTHGLGSCVGLAVYDPVSRIGGLLHVMMPSSAVNPVKAKTHPYMFVDTGVPKFFDELLAAGAVKNRLVVKVTGGAKVTNNLCDHFQIGRKNYVALRKVLWKKGVLINAEDVGGNSAITMYLDVGSGRVWLKADGREWKL